ncbi:tyrosine-type recombinase/integrase [Rhodococcus sp. NPDC019627]|uniref:tyrosine-type recombinase/integrase n=1 Tax=unclassified Rhodococcus (in: high G+C Gram-positive bacteria) TaxID=192944 RepID=UPI0034028B58
MGFKTLYGWGLRRNEVRHLQLVDLSRNARAPFFGEWGLVRVRHGKAMRGAPAKQRTVLTVFDWAAEALADWCERGLPRYGHPIDTLFPTEKGGMIPTRNLWQRMGCLVDELGFPPGLDLHSFRRAYATNLQVEYGYDVSFVQLILSHRKGVHDVLHALSVSGCSRGGGGYLRLSITQIPRRSDACTARFDARLVVRVVDGPRRQRACGTDRALPGLPHRHRAVAKHGQGIRPRSEGLVRVPSDAGVGVA